MRWGATEDMSSVQECAMQASLWMNKGRASLERGQKAKEAVGIRTLSVWRSKEHEHEVVMIVALQYIVTKAHIDRKRGTHHLTPRASCKIFTTRQARCPPAEASRSPDTQNIGLSKNNGAMHAAHDLDGDHHSAFVLPECGALVPERPE